MTNCCLSDKNTTGTPILEYRPTLMRVQIIKETIGTSEIHVEAHSEVCLYLGLKEVNTKVGEIIECHVNQRKKNTSAVVKLSKQRKNMKRI